MSEWKKMRQLTEQQRSNRLKECFALAGTPDREDLTTTEWVNDKYHVVARRLEPEAVLGEGINGYTMIHLSIKRHDKEPCHDWRDFQRIKDDIAGEEWEAVELYPAQSRLVDNANQYHLWAFPFHFPFGFPKRLVTDGSLVNNTRQRPVPADWRISTEEEAADALGLDRGALRELSVRLEEASNGS